MLRRFTRRGAPFTIAAWFTLTWLFQGCGGRDVMIAESFDAEAPPAFVEPDAGTPVTQVTLTEYCPSTECTVPYTTCTTSQYPCDVNLMTDPHNCGSCGFDCKGSGTATFDCISGKCAIRCKKDLSFGLLQNADCNGFVDDDCETMLGTNDNCNGCGDRCDDPAKPCVPDYKHASYKCGCDEGLIYCMTPRGAACVDPATDDNNCGGCGNVCDGAGKPEPPPHSEWGCLGSECGHLKCKDEYADCDDDLNVKPESSSNGCETSIETTDDCGACGKACAPGQACFARPDGFGGTLPPACICGPGETLCGIDCVKLLTDQKHCGACENNCKLPQDLFGDDEANSVPVCRYGACAVNCKDGFGDCNGDPKDGCEVNLMSDQRNCGACGNACDALAGQPCIGGQCAVRPCGEGEEAAR